MEPLHPFSLPFSKLVEMPFAGSKPKPTPETKHFWEGCRNGKLLLQRCPGHVADHAARGCRAQRHGGRRPSAQRHRRARVLRYMKATGTTHEHLAMVAVVQREWAAQNPRALFQERVTVEEVLASRMVSYPFRLLQCCPVTDGGGALILAAALARFPQDRTAACAGNVAEEAFAARCVEEAVKTFGAVHGLVNNAGDTRPYRECSGMGKTRAIALRV